MKKHKLNFRNIETLEVDDNVTLYEVSKHVKDYFEYPIMCAKLDNEIVGLDTVVTKKANIDFFDLSTKSGNVTYSHSVYFMMILAIKRILGYDADVIIEHSIDNGVYCRIVNAFFDKETLKILKQEMNKIIKEDLKFTKLNVRRLEALKYFKDLNQIDKVNVLKYTSNSFVNLYRLDDLYDYFFSSLAYSTKDLYNFKLSYIQENAFILSVPTTSHPDYTLEYNHIPKVLNEFEEYGKWCQTIGVNNAADLNNFVVNGNYNKIIRLSEIRYENQLMNIADEIYSKKNKIKLVLLAGPSSSGKTTSAKKLCLYLESKGLKTHVLSTDDYFKEREDSPKDEFGEYDFECLDAIDLNLFNRHLTKLLDGEKVNIPEFNFITGKKEFNNNWLQIENDDIIVIEGLHCLNEELTSAVSRNNKYKILICPFTQINIDNHNKIHNSDVRKLRRIIRDNKHRGYNATSTLKMWSKIKKGEQKYIFPFQNDADACINSALLYEIGVLKVYAEPLLYAVDENDSSYPEAIRLINVLKNFLPIPSDDIPKDSFLREFIGGSGFEK